MRKTYCVGFTMAAALATATLQAQIYTPSGAVNTSLSSGGNVGIGTDTPSGQLHVSGYTDDVLLLKADVFDRLDTWDYPDNALRVIGVSGVQQYPGPPSFGTVFKVDRKGATEIGDFPSSPPNMLSVRNNMGVYSGTSTWMRFRFAGSGSGNQPELSWRASGNNHFRFKNDETNTTAMTLSKGGEVGVGTEAFTGDHSLYVEGSAVMDWLTVQDPSQWGAANDYLQLKHEAGPEIKWRSSDNSNLRFHANNTDVMYLSPEGKLGIGTDNFVNDYSLYVAGSMVAEEAFIRIEEDWGDFVFEEDYPLMPLQELDSYLKQHKHLPDFPSATEVKENGLALGETERLLTIKVEELTLYLIDMKREMEALREEITTLRGEK